MAKLAKLAYIPTVFIKCHLYKRTPILQENVHIFLFWLNPTGHSKFHNTSNHPPPATDSGRTVSTPLYPPTSADGRTPPHLTPSPPFFFPLSPTEEPAKADTHARDRPGCSECAH